MQYSAILELHIDIMSEKAPINLINFDNVPGGIVSGLSTEQFEQVAYKSMRKTFYDEDSEEDAVELNSDQLQFLSDLEKCSIPTGTVTQTKNHIAKFRGFLETQKLTANFENLPNETLNDYLRLFYSSLKTKTGTFYSPSSLICIRASIQRHLTSPDVNRTINIIRGDDFKRANGVLRSMVGKFLNSSQQKGKEYDAINEDDFQKVLNYFTRTSTQVLQDEVLFNTIYYFGLRGRENLRNMKCSTIVIKSDSSGAQYAVIDVPMASKNVKASLNSKEHTDFKQARMYEKSDKSCCPVEALKLYKDSFPSDADENTPLFLKCTKNGLSKVPVGKTILSDFMKNLSKKLNLSKIYTNHCIRVTVVTIMREKNFPVKDIMLVTGHKNTSSVERYDRKRRDSDFRNLSAKLSETVNDCTNEKKIFHISNECNMSLTVNETVQSQIPEDSRTGTHQKKARLHTSWGLLEIDL